MSTTLTVGATAYSIQELKATTAYGQLAQIPLRGTPSGHPAGALFQVSLAKIPKGATIVSAVVQFRTVAAAAGTFTARLYTTAKWPSSLTWAKRPATTLRGSVSVTNPAASALFAIPVTATVQEMVSGTIANNGWFLDISEWGPLKVRGSAATSGRPVLVVTYTVRPPAPTNLEPSNAAVSVAAPVMLFDADPSITGLRLQIDAAADAASPDFDSGTVPATGGLLDLAAFIANRVTNFGFETDASGWTGVNATLARTTAQAATGAASLQITASAAGTAEATTAAGTSGYPVVPGQTYSSRADFRSATVSRNARFGIYWYTATGAFLSSMASGIVASSTSAWTSHQFASVAPATAAYARVALQFLGAAGAGEVHYADNVGFRGGSPYYTGLTAGAATYWRAQQQTDGGWSDWSPWEPFTREARAALTITSPAGAAPVPVSDGTPPITWTFAGTQVAWRARLLNANGDPIADSGRNLGTDNTWTPPKGLVSVGQAGLVEVTVWDNSNRASTPGDPAETIATVAVVLTPNNALEGYTAVTAANQGYDPTVTVTGKRSAIPDWVALRRDGREIDRWPGADVTVPASGGGYISTVTDQTAVMNRAAVYALVPVVNGVAGPLGATVTYTPHCKGIWLASIETGETVALWGNEGAEQAQPELSVVHRPIIEGDAVPVVRRRLMRSAPEGSVSGLLLDVGPYSAEVMEERLRSWVDGDAGDLFTLTLAGYTGRVIIGDVTFSEVNSNPGDGRALVVSLNWWAQ